MIICPYINNCFYKYLWFQKESLKLILLQSQFVKCINWYYLKWLCEIKCFTKSKIKYWPHKNDESKEGWDIRKKAGKWTSVKCLELKAKYRIRKKKDVQEVLLPLCVLQFKQEEKKDKWEMFNHNARDKY